MGMINLSLMKVENFTHTSLGRPLFLLIDENIFQDFPKLNCEVEEN